MTDARSPRRLVALIVAGLLVAGCGGAREGELKHAVAVVRSIIEDAGRNIRPGTGPRDFVIEGYGETVGKPLHVETITVGIVKPPG